MNGTAAAFGATGFYYVGFAIFRLAAVRMEPLRGHRLVHLVWQVLSNWIFLAGLGLVFAGLALQIVALSELAVSVAVPIFVSGLIPLLLISVICFGERLTPREMFSLLLVAAAMLCVALSISSEAPSSGAEVPLWRLGLVAGPALAVPLVLMAIGDHRPDGRHSRPVSGIAYGLSAGFPVGVAELSIKGWCETGTTGTEILRTPFPYVMVLAAALGFAILQVGFQRCRASIVATVMTISAKSYLLVMATVLYGEPWPSDRRGEALRVAALTLAALAVLLIPRHERRRRAQASEPDPSAQISRPPVSPSGQWSRSAGR